MPIAFVCFLVSGLHGAGLWGGVALEGLFLEREEVWDPVLTFRHRELLEGGGGVLGVCHGWVVEARRLMVACVAEGQGLRGRFPRPLPRQGGERGLGIFSGGRAFGWAGRGEALLTFWRHFAGVLAAPVGLVLGGDAADGMGFVQLNGFRVRFVSGTWLFWLVLGVPLYPDMHPAVVVPATDAVVYLPFAPYPAACLVVAKGLLDPRALLEFWVGVGLWRGWRWEGG